MAALLMGGLFCVSSQAMAQTLTDVTSTYLTNADLSSGSGTGWTKTGNWADNSGTANGTVYVSENYAGWGALDQTDFALKQTVTLPAGLYKIDAYALYRGTVGNVLLSATSASKTLGSVAVASAGAMSSSGSNDLQKAANSFNPDYNYLNTVYFYLSASAEVTIGYVGTHTEKQQWFVAGPMKLYKYADDSTISSSATLDFTSLIFNPSFESGNTNGWTTTTSSDTGARSTTNDTYKMSGSHGNYLFNTWWKGTPCTQTLANLPAGQYELSSVVASDGATIYLINGDDTNDYAYTETTNSAIGITLKKSFLLTSDASNYKIGVVGGADGTAGEHKAYQADGYWWYKCDNFTLTYKGNGVEHYATSQGGDAAADTWYVQNITVAGSYTLTTNGSATIVYTQNPALEPDNVTATASNGDELTLAVGTIYYKATATTPLTIAAASYTYEVGTATVDYAYVQGGETVTVTYADAVTNDPSASFAKNGNPTITFGGSAVTVTPTSNGFTFTVPAVTPSTNYTLSIPANAFGYAANDTYNAAQEITINASAVFDGVYFFKDDNDKFWLRGEPYGSAVQVYDWGMPVNVTTDAMGATTLHFADASDWKIFSDGTGIFADNASHANSTWSIIKSGTKYFFKNAVNNHYMKVDGTRILSTATEGEATAFTLVTPAHHQNVLTAYVNAQASTAATAAGLSASTPAELQTAADGINATTVIGGTTAATTAEKWQGGQWDSRTVYSNTVNVTTPGLYKFTIQGFYRMTDNDATYALHTAQADCPPVYVFFGDAKTPIRSVMDESRATAYEGNNCDYANGVNHFPNQQASSLVAFKEGKYTNTVWVYIAEAGDYTYGIQYLGWAGSHSEWTCYTTESISLTYYYSGSFDYVEDGVHYYKGAFDTAPAIELTDAVPVADLTDATFSGTSSVTFTNPNGLVFANAASQVSNTTNVVVNGTCESLALADGHPFVNPSAFTATNASYTLSALADGSFATLMLPFAATAPGGSVYALNQGVNLIDGNLYGTATSIAANSPVLVTASGSYIASNVTVPVVASGATFTNGELVGTYSAVEAPVGSYVLQNHTGGEGVAFYLVGSTQPTLNPFRAYIKAQGGNVKAFKVLFDDADGVEAVEIEPSISDAKVFNLSGQRLNNPVKGINIVNGKKVLVK